MYGRGFFFLKSLLLVYNSPARIAPVIKISVIFAGYVIHHYRICLQT